MSKKHKRQRTADLPLSDRESRIRKALSEGRTQQALELAKHLYKEEPTPARKELLGKAYWERGRDLRGRGYLKDAITVFENAVHFCDGDKVRLGMLVKEMAECGGIRQALTLSDGLRDEGLRAQVLIQAADTALSQGAEGRKLLPEPLLDGFDRIRNAFAQAAAGQDEPARETLRGVGLLSPFLEWKMLVRGLIAFYRHEDALALENWQRLSHDRLPARLSAPLRFLIDPAYRTAQPPAAQARLQKQADRLQDSVLLPSLRSIQSLLAKREVMEALRCAEQLLPTLRQEAPQLLPRLAVCFYWAVVDSDESICLERYQRTFGAPADDPELQRLQALFFEQDGDLEEAHRHWQQFERFTLEHANVWHVTAGVDSASCVNHVRSLIWSRMGQNAAHVPDVNEFPNLPSFLRNHPDCPRPLVPGAEQCFLRSLELAPDWLESYETLLGYYQKKQDDPRAEAQARRLLERFPDHAATLEVLADMLHKQKDYPAGLQYYRRALAANPLERRLRVKTSYAHTLHARAHAEAGRFAEARAEYQASLGLSAKNDLYPVFCKWAACELKAGATVQAEELLQKALADANDRLAVAVHMAIEAHRSKLPRALSRRFETDLQAGLAEPPAPESAVRAVEIFGSHRVAEVEYRGQKSHEKAALAYLEKIPRADFNEKHLERLCLALLHLKITPLLRKFTAHGRKTFPRNPSFYLREVQALSLSRRKKPRAWQTQSLLSKARQLAEQLPKDDHQQALLEEIVQLEDAAKLEKIAQFDKLAGATNPFGSGFLEMLAGSMFNAGEVEEEDEEFEDEDEEPFTFFGRRRGRPRKGSLS